MVGIIFFFFINDKKLSSHMDQISEHINFSNHKIHSYDKMSKMIVNLGSNKFENNNNNSSWQLTCLHNSSLMIIVNTPENGLSNVDQKYYMIKVRTSSVKSSSTLFSCSICIIYNRGNSAEKQRLVLKSYITGISSLIYPKRHSYNIFFEKLVNELDECVYKVPCERQSPNISNSVF